MEHKNLAMAYALKRRAKKMARGGMSDDPTPITGVNEDAMKKEMYAEGGMAEEEMEYDPTENPMPKDNMAAEDEDEDMISRIMRKRYSKGGMVANDTPPVADFEENDFDDLALRDELESSYTGANSGDTLGNGREAEDEEDMIRRIMRSRAKGGVMPRPA